MNDRGPPNGNNPIAAGVEALIARLRDEGVGEGREAAKRVVAEAEARARWMIAQAEQEADTIRSEARRAATRFRQAGEESLRTAARDVILTLKATLSQQFAREIERLVSARLKDRELLGQLIIEIAGRSRAEIETQAPLEVLLPSDTIGIEALRQKPEELQQGPLTQFVLAVTGDILREGVTFGVDEDMKAGIQVRLTDSGVTLDLSDRAIAQLLLQYLQPRFRALLEGIVK
jgi:V/A-type H+-transporting ATPase subunit E